MMYLSYGSLKSAVTHPGCVRILVDFDPFISLELWLSVHQMKVKLWLDKACGLSVVPNSRVKDISSFERHLPLGEGREVYCSNQTLVGG